MKSQFSISVTALLVSFGLLTNVQAEELWSLDESPRVEGKQVPNPLPKKHVAKQKLVPEVIGNLPVEYKRRDFGKLVTTSSSTILPAKGQRTDLKRLKVGDSLIARVKHSIIAFPDEKPPVIAEILDGPLEGWRLIGESRLEKNSKRIFINFRSIARGGLVYHFKGEALTSFGQPGFEGEYYSREGSYFAGDFIASMTAAYFDGLVPRNTNAYGQIQADNSIDSAFKKGLAGGAMSTAERFREQLKRAPEFSELDGPIDVQVLILEKAVEAD